MMQETWTPETPWTPEVWQQLHDAARLLARLKASAVGLRRDAHALFAQETKAARTPHQKLMATENWFRRIERGEELILQGLLADVTSIACSEASIPAEPEGLRDSLSVTRGEESKQSNVTPTPTYALHDMWGALYGAELLRRKAAAEAKRNGSLQKGAT
jgi:hypothetical protein